MKTNPWETEWYKRGWNDYVRSGKPTLPHWVVNAIEYEDGFGDAQAMDAKEELS